LRILVELYKNSGTFSFNKQIGLSLQPCAGKQAEAFFNQKYEEPYELVVTAKFKDVDGIEYPEKKFRIFKKKDMYGLIDVGCEPIFNQTV
jgi:hypothetical protein